MQRDPTIRNSLSLKQKYKRCLKNVWSKPRQDLLQIKHYL